MSPSSSSVRSATALSSRWKARTFAVVVGSLLAMLLACTKASNAEPCNRDADCASGKCALNFRCAPGECECKGAECGSARSSCDEGEVCVAGQPPFEIGYNRCRRACVRDSECSAGDACDDGFCSEGPIAALSWAPGAGPPQCQKGVTCTYGVNVRPGIEVRTFRWTFGDSTATGTAETTEPIASHAFAAAGTFQVSVVGILAQGSTLAISRTATVCGGGLGAACDAKNELACCTGSCLQGVCK